MAVILPFTKENWRQWAFQGHGLMLVDLREGEDGPGGDGTADLLPLVSYFDPWVAVGTLDLSGFLTKAQIRWFQPGPILVFFDHGRMVHWFRGSDRIQRMVLWLSRTQDWSPEYSVL